MISELRHKYKLEGLLEITSVPRSTFYYNNSKLNKPGKYKEVKKVIKGIFEHNKGRYGYRRITIELRKQGYIINHKTVSKLMKECGLKCKIRAKKYNSYKGGTSHILENKLKRDFKAVSPNKKWVTDVTEFNVRGEKVYLSPILDLFNNEIVSYNISRRANFMQITDMLDKAFKKLPETPDLILHSDQGWQYRLEKYQVILKEKGITQSMSGKGNCYDNAVIENFFGILKSEMFYDNKLVVYYLVWRNK